MSSTGCPPQDVLHRIYVMFSTGYIFLFSTGYPPQDIRHVLHGIYFCVLHRIYAMFSTGYNLFSTGYISYARCFPPDINYILWRTDYILWGCPLEVYPVDDTFTVEDILWRTPVYPVENMDILWRISCGERYPVEDILWRTL